MLLEYFSRPSPPRGWIDKKTFGIQVIFTWRAVLDRRDVVPLLARTARVDRHTTIDLAGENMPKLFDRFWRKETARSGGTHVGLGLALSRTFARAMGWTLTAALIEPSRIAFTLTGPAADGRRRE